MDNKYLVGSGHLAFAYGKVVVDKDFAGAASEVTKALSAFGMGTVANEIQSGIRAALPPDVKTP